ncbi:hypothetical protein CFAM422_012200 [Trichoderma lentiforme]|uniref:Uncharacterized protein n=1 Tax=Trichoderma lentiforme TaxID=1567552 RepID=A0A9P5C8H7_9HYPO|nr:hypothetical protein CFAM422_012200 [Trichoderma lentiforme]
MTTCGKCPEWSKLELHLPSSASGEGESARFVWKGLGENNGLAWTIAAPPAIPRQILSWHLDI